MAVVHVDADSFKAMVLQSDTPVLVDFWADWCQPCHMLSPIVDEVAGLMSGQVTVAKVNIDNNPALADEYKVQSIPTLILFKGGKVSSTLVGVKPKSEILKMLQA